MKILILGGSRHGKTSVAEFISQTYGLRLVDASLHAAELFIREALKPICEYPNAEACYLDRHRYYDLWRELIAAYNQDDPGRLVRSVMENSDIYVGIRNPAVYEAVRDDFDLILYVDAVGRVPADPAMHSLRWDRDNMIRIDNSGSRLRTCEAVRAAMTSIGATPLPYGLQGPAP